MQTLSRILLALFLLSLHGTFLSAAPAEDAERLAGMLRLLVIERTAAGTRPRVLLPVGGRVMRVRGPWSRSSSSVPCPAGAVIDCLRGMCRRSILSRCYRLMPCASGHRLGRRSASSKWFGTTRGCPS